MPGPAETTATAAAATHQPHRTARPLLTDADAGLEHDLERCATTVQLRPGLAEQLIDFVLELLRLLVAESPAVGPAHLVLTPEGIRWIVGDEVAADPRIARLDAERRRRVCLPLHRSTTSKTA